VNAVLVQKYENGVGGEGCQVTLSTIGAENLLAAFEAMDMILEADNIDSALPALVDLLQHLKEVKRSIS